ncbi:MAG TPA: DNA-binding protein [Lentisphaeria bacterium]|nr:MAG: hypothetical protein A2X47_04185 [Lentisphaerae bacterium GWF2_38_69]HBM16187.1 DNA-binding protein [Lentisphaeria bacterium]
MNSIIPVESIESKIIVLRGKKVLLDRDLAILYGVETRSLNQAAKRNIERFPDDFMFRLNKEEVNSLVSQFVIPSVQHLGGSMPHVFTEQGVAMLSSVLKSERAIQVNIMIMRAFVKIREVISSHSEIARRISELESRVDNHDETIVEIINALKKLIPIYSDKPKIGF